MLINRLAHARTFLENHELDCILFVKLPNIRYLSGFTGSDGALVLGRESGWFLTDSRYTYQAAEQVQNLSTIEYRTKLEGVTDLLSRKGAKRVGFEGDTLSIATHRSLQAKNPGVEFVDIGSELETLRIIKDDRETAMLAETAAIASSAFLRLLDRIGPGKTERELALALEWEMRSAGADDKSFDFIVASGVRGALPHGKASGKIIEAGELVTFDFGAILDGYCSDETVTVGVGALDSRQREIHGIVKEAHDRAIAAVRPGVACRDIDAVARDFIAGHGYGDYFGHGLGHGVGLEVHEKPVVSPRSEETLRAGMVVTIEPGIYIPGWGGVRIEDTVCVTDSGCRLLTQVPKDLQIL